MCLFVFSILLFFTCLNVLDTACLELHNVYAAVHAMKLYLLHCALYHKALWACTWGYIGCGVSIGFAKEVRGLM